MNRRAALRIGMGAVALAFSAIVLLPATAFAAGSGYTPAGGGTGGTATGLPGSVVTTTTIQPSGGTASGVVGNATITVTVPAGAFQGPVQVVITDASSSTVTPSSGGTVVVTFGVGFYQNGTKVTGSFPAVSVVVTSPSITAASTVYFVTGAGLQSVSGSAVKAGSAAFSVTSDPVVELVTPVSATSTAGPGSAIPGATSTQTGKPFFLESILAGGLIAFGLLLLVGLRLRRHTA